MPKKTIHELVSNLKKLSAEMGGKTPTVIEFVSSGESKRQIQNYKYSEIVKLAGLEANTHSQKTDPVEIRITPPKILVFDLEVSTKIVHTYQMWDTNISPNCIIEDFYILAFSAKFVGEDTVHYLDTRYSPKCDLHILEALSHLINEATHLCGHNLKRFDLPTLRARMIQRGVAPIPELPVIDTLSIAKRLFKFSSNKLSELAKYLDCDVLKDDHSKFPGISLFTESMNGNMEAFQAMEHYCKTDSIVTEKILTKLMPWEPAINFQSNYQKVICSCGGDKFYRNGMKYTRSGAFQINRCSACSKCYVDKSNLIDKDLRKGFSR